MVDQKSALLSEARNVLHNLIQSGYEAYLVGGFVRDHVLDRPVHDIDIATSAVPEEVLRLFSRAVPTGIEHGTVTVISGGCSFEVTTFRREGGYQDHRRPDYVEFVDSLVEDLSRRDFTMNAMAMDIDGNVIDPFSGKSDLTAGVLRCVGEADRRFEEDALRMLRCVRFAANYGLQIDEEAWSAMSRLRPSLKHIAMERVRIELSKTIEGSDPARGVDLLLRSGLLVYTKEPLEWRPMALADRRSEDMSCQPYLEQNRLKEMSIAARWASLFILGDHPAHEAEAIMRKLTFSNEMKNHILRVLYLYEEIHAALMKSSDRSSEQKDGIAADMHHDIEFQELFIDVSIKLGRQAAYDYLELLQQPSLVGTSASGIREIAKAWLDRIQVWAPSDLAVNGHDMMQLRTSLRKGPWIGKLLHRLTVDVALGRLANTRELLLAHAEQYVEEWDIH